MLPPLPYPFMLAYSLTNLDSLHPYQIISCGITSEDKCSWVGEHENTAKSVQTVKADRADKKRDDLQLEMDSFVPLI